MIVLLMAFGLCAAVFGARSVLGGGLWPYYIPAALMFTLGWMHILHVRHRCVARRLVREHLDLLERGERDMLLCSPSIFVPRLATTDVLWLLAQCGNSYVMPMTLMTALVYLVLCLVLRNWGPAFLSGGLLLYALLGPLANAFDTWDPADAAERAVDRYLNHLRRRHALSRQDVPSMGMRARVCYGRLDLKLKYLSEYGEMQAPIDRVMESHVSDLW